MTGLTTALQLDPLTKREIWLFQKIGQAFESGRPVYRRLQYNLVRYDGDPTEYVEPDTASGDFYRVIDGTGSPIDPRVDGAGNVVEFRFFDARPFEMFAINDVDVSGIGQLP